MTLEWEELPMSERHRNAIRYAVASIRESELAANVRDLYLYGSCARNQMRWGSDIDLLLVLDEAVIHVPDYRSKLRLLKSSIAEDFPDSVEADLKIVIGDAWQDNAMMFYKNIRTEGISLWH